MSESSIFNKQTVEEDLLSGSVGGKQIKITQTASPGTLLHTGLKGSGRSYDKVDVYVNNPTGGDLSVILEVAGVTADDRQTVSVPATSTKQVGVEIIVPPGKELRAYCSSAVYAWGVAKHVKQGL